MKSFARRVALLCVLSPRLPLVELALSRARQSLLPQPLVTITDASII